jgi:hypothetical protein
MTVTRPAYLVLEDRTRHRSRRDRELCRTPINPGTYHRKSVGVEKTRTWRVENPKIADRKGQSPGPVNRLVKKYKYGKRGRRSRRKVGA